MPARPAAPASNPSLMGRLRNYAFAGLLLLGPTAVTLWVLYLVFNWLDNLLGRYMRFEGLVGGHRIPGLGLLATLVLLVIVGWVASWIGARPLLNMWDRLLTRIPGASIVYASTKSLGEAFLTRNQEVFRKVVLLPYPHSGIWAIGFLTTPPTEPMQARFRERVGEEVLSVFVPTTPNPTGGFYQMVPRSKVILLDWPVEEGIKVVMSGGLVQPVEDSSGRVVPPSLPGAGGAAAS